VEREENGVLNWTGEVRCLEHRLDWPLTQKKPARIFTSSLGDLFHPAVPFEFLDKVFVMMARADWHIFQILTKQSTRMLEYFQYVKSRFATNWEIEVEGGGSLTRGNWPLPNVWLGVSAENQTQADARIPLLLQVPATIRFASAEPLLGSLELSQYLEYAYLEGPEKAYSPDTIIPEGYPKTSKTVRIRPQLDWVIVGGESGKGARPMHQDWVRSLHSQCRKAGVAFHLKQWGEWLPLSSADEASHYPAVALTDTHSHVRVGRKKAGRKLEGREWNEFPRELEIEKGA
jgi:protein gp37